MPSKNNPNRAQKETKDLSITHPNFYGFNAGFWCGSNAPTLEEARADIRAKMKLKKSAKFEVKPYDIPAYKK